VPERLDFVYIRRPAGRNVAGAGIEYRRAIELNPNYVHAHQWYSQYLCELGRFDDRVPEADRAHALDPLNLMAGIDVGTRLTLADLRGLFRKANSPLKADKVALLLVCNFSV
jgi:hypothetical protein